MTETVTTRGQGCDRAWLGQEISVHDKKTIVLLQDFVGLCRDRVFFVVTEFS